MDATPSTPTTARTDGRDRRWEQHRLARRRELIEAAITAIRRHGATVGMDEIAAVAGTSKTVVYRHLGDRLGLYLAVCEAVDAQILRDFSRAMEVVVGGNEPLSTLRQTPRHALVAVIDSYLRLVEQDPEVYRFVTRRPLVDVPVDQDPIAGLSDTIAQALASFMQETLATLGKDASAATTWSHGLVGFVRESADRWLVDPARPPREAVVHQLADFAAYGLVGVLDLTDPPAPAADRTDEEN